MITTDEAVTGHMNHSGMMGGEVAPVVQVARLPRTATPYHNPSVAARATAGSQSAVVPETVGNLSVVVPETVGSQSVVVPRTVEIQ